MLTQFNRNNLQQLRIELNIALREVGIRHGMQIDIGNIRFSPREASVKMSLVLGETKNDAERASFQENAEYFNLQPSDYGAIIKIRENNFRLVEIRKNSRKYPLVGEKNGKRYKLPLSPSIKQKIEEARSNNHVS